MKWKGNLSWRFHVPELPGLSWKQFGQVSDLEIASEASRAHRTALPPWMRPWILHFVFLHFSFLASQLRMYGRHGAITLMFVVHSCTDPFLVLTQGVGVVPVQSRAMMTLIATLMAPSLSNVVMFWFSWNLTRFAKVV